MTGRRATAAGTDRLGYAVVVPTLGRPSLARLLRTLGDQPAGLAPAELVLADDRPDRAADRLPMAQLRAAIATVRPPLRVVRTFGHGPAAARNAGWRATRARWVVFLDDDVELTPGWALGLRADLLAAGPEVGGVQGRLRVPLPPGSRPTDWQRGTAGLQDAAWATADMAYRRAALEDVAGFDERFPRAYREDADLALRVMEAGWQLRRGERCALHPVRPAGDWISLRVQRGNADDALMAARHGAGWRERAQAPAGRLRRHALTSAAALASGAAALAGRRRVAAVAGLAWAALTAEFAARRLAPGPRPWQPGGPAEYRRMLLTSLAIPPVALRHRLAGEWRHRRTPPPAWPVVAAVLFDRDGTLVHDVPYNGDPALVDPVEGAAEAVAAARAAGLRIGVVSNQAGVARGRLTLADVAAVNAEIDHRIGPFDTWQICPHAPADGCACRKPAPGMVLTAARQLGVRPSECVLIGDILADVEAARAAGARGILVPTPLTLPEEVLAAGEVAPSLLEAVTRILPQQAHGPRAAASVGSVDPSAPVTPVAARSSGEGAA